MFCVLVGINRASVQQKNFITESMTRMAPGSVIRVFKPTIRFYDWSIGPTYSYFLDTMNIHPGLRLNLAFLFVLQTSCLFGQTNLVPNHSFENYSSCPSSNSQLSKANSWMPPSSGTPDYFNHNMACNYGNQPAYTGTGSVGIYLFNSTTFNCSSGDYREYIKVQLSSALLAGQSYDVSFWINVRSITKWTTDNVGAYFSSSPTSSANACYLPLVPQVVQTPGSYFPADTWFQVSGSFVASGGEQYLTIGNFEDNANTNLQSIGGAGNAAYAILDEICVALSGSNVCNIVLSLPDSDTLGPANSQMELPGELTVYPNPANSRFWIESGIAEMDEEDIRVEVFDLKMRKIFEERASFSKGQVKRLELSLEETNSSMYILRIRDENQYYIRKILME